MKRNKLFSPLIVWIFIIAFGLLRMSIIDYNELASGTPTMTGEFTFLAYIIIASIVSLMLLIISKINSLNEDILNNIVKVIINISIVILMLPIVFIMLLFFH